MKYVVVVIWRMILSWTEIVFDSWGFQVYIGTDSKSTSSTLACNTLNYPIRVAC